MDLNKVNIIIFGGDNYNTLGMIRTLGEKKLSFHAIIVRNYFVIASKSKYLKHKQVDIVTSVEDGYKILLDYGKSLTEKAFILVEGDYLTGFLDRNYDELCNKFIWNCAGKQGELSKYLNKQAQIELVKGCGIKVPASQIVNKGEVPEDIEYPIMTKAVTSEIAAWKSEVHICHNEDELKNAYTKIKSDKIILQKYIKKKNELCLDGYSINKGNSQFISMSTSYTYLLDDGYSFYATISDFEDKELEDKVTEVMKKVGYEGIYCIEFIIDEDDTPYFLEINFRNSGWSYASTCVDMPLPILWIESMLTRDVDIRKKKKIPSGYTFVDDIADFKTRAGKIISYKQWLKEYKNCDCKLIMGRNDYKPFFSYLWFRYTNMIKRKIQNKIQSNN